MNKNKSESPLPPKGGVRKSMSFPEAIQALMNGKMVRRLDWADGNEYCLLQENFLRIHRNSKFHNWIVSEGDMLAIDWVIK